MTRIGLALLLLFGVPALAAPPENAIPFNDERGRPVDSIAVPPQSPVAFAGWIKRGFPVAKFKGRFLLTGTYYYGDGEYNDGPHFSGEATIFPDDTSNLPHFVIRSTVRGIFIDNPDAFAAAVVPAKMIRKVRRRRGDYATGHIAIWADGFTAEITCDFPSYGTHFVSVYTPAAVRVAASKQLAGC